MSELRNTTVILTNWKRPDNLDKVIESILKQTVPVNIWLWDNSGENRPFNVDYRVNSIGNMFCWPRWLLATMVKTRYVLIMDDDLMLARDTVIEDCEDICNANSSYILGVYGVRLNEQKDYFKSAHLRASNHTQGVDIVKGRFMFMDRKLINLGDLEPDYYCDDIKISSKALCVLPSKLADATVNLPEGKEALFEQEGQRERRQEAVEKYFK